MGLALIRSHVEESVCVACVKRYQGAQWHTLRRFRHVPLQRTTQSPRRLREISSSRDKVVRKPFHSAHEPIRSRFGRAALAKTVVYPTAVA